MGRGWGLNLRTWRANSDFLKVSDYKNARLYDLLLFKRLLNFGAFEVHETSNFNV